MKVSTLYIAQIKKKYGLDMRENYNKSTHPKRRIPICPVEKEAAILDALKHFKMLDPDVEMITGNEEKENEE